MKVEVVGHNIPHTNEQPYALVIAGMIGSGTCDSAILPHCKEMDMAMGMGMGMAMAMAMAMVMVMVIVKVIVKVMVMVMVMAMAMVMLTLICWFRLSRSTENRCC